MLPDFELIQHQFYGGQDITIIPIADVHLGSPECMEQEFIAFCKQLAETPNTYAILLGDLIDNGLKNSLTNCYKATMSPSVQKREMANILEPIKDKILCIVPGNHERRSAKDVDDDPCYDIAVKLDIEHLYRENIAFVKIQLGKENIQNGAYRPTYTIVVTHGAGGGILTGGAVNRSERFGYVIDGMDAIVVGHTHKPYHTSPGKILIDTRNNVISMKQFEVVSATSWLGYGGYSARGMMRPAAYRPAMFTLTGDHKEIIYTSRERFFD